MNIFRNHKRAMLLFMFVAIGVPMLFFGIPWGGQGMNSGVDAELANVGGVSIMASEFHQNLNLAARRNTRPGEDAPTFKELHEQGVAGQVMQEMLASALIEREENARGFEVEQSMIEEQLRDDPTFKDDVGNFIPSRYNAWVQANERMDWGALYAGIGDQIARQVYMNTVLAPANRVLDEDIEQALVDNATKIQMEYLKIEPAIEPTEEQISSYYEENKENYREPDNYTASYVRFPLSPEPSEEVLAVVEKARAGEDFAALADEHSDLETDNGGDLGWLAERETELDYRKPLFALKPGEVSDPVPGPGGFYIYKVEDERTNEETGAREIKARHLYMKVELSDEEKLERELKAQELSDKAKELGSLTAAAEAMGLPVEQAEGFNVETADIEGIPAPDAFQFRRVVDEEAAKEATEYPVIIGSENLYVAEVVETTEGDLPPLEEVRDIVTQDVIAQERNSEAYRERVATLAESIKEQATTLDEVTEKFPEITGTIKETRPFSKSEFLFQDQIYLQTPEIYEALEGKEVGQLAGPLTDFLGATYFIALTNRQEPTEEDKAAWEEEGDALRQQRINQKQAELLQDYLVYLRERELPRVDWSINQDVYDQIVGIADEEEAAPLDVEMPEPGEVTGNIQEGLEPADDFSGSPVDAPIEGESVQPPGTDIPEAAPVVAPELVEEVAPDAEPVQEPAPAAAPPATQ